MHAIAKLVKILPNQTEQSIDSAMPGLEPSTDIHEGETVKVRLWHGHCLEAEAIISVSSGRTSVKLIQKKELRKDAPSEALG